MKSLLRLVYLCVLASLACNGLFHAPDLRITPFPTATPAPCPSSQVVSTARVRRVMIDFLCGVTNSQRDQVVEYVRAALVAMPPGIDPIAEIFVFVDLDMGVDQEYRWFSAHGYRPQKPELLKGWEHYMGRATRGSAFLYLRRSLGAYGPSAELADLVLHEMHHLLQYELQPALIDPPQWWTEGGARYFAYVGVRDLGMQPWRFGAPPDEACDYPLRLLEFEDERRPVDCVYDEGQLAVRLLVQDFGATRYLQLYRQWRAYHSFADTFETVYRMPLQRFYNRFDEYRESGYTVRPVLIRPNPAPRLDSPR